VGWDQNASGLPAGDSTEDSEAARRANKELEMEAEEAAKWAYVAPRWQTRLFAVECVRRLLAVLEHSAHFDLATAQQEQLSAINGGDYLVCHMPELVSVAFTSATSPLDAMRPAGIAAVLDIAEKFALADDPEYEGHLLLELYSAQITATLRPCFGEEAEPSLTAIGCAATARFLLAVGSSARGHEVDPASVRKLLALLMKASGASELRELTYPQYAEETATMVRAAALQATAQVWQACSAVPTEYAEIARQVAPSLASLRDGWLALLRDFSLLDTLPKEQRRAYRSHLYAPSQARAAHSQLLSAWTTILSATIATAHTGMWKVGRESAMPVGATLPPDDGAGGGAAESALQPISTRPMTEDVPMLLGLCVHRLITYAAAAGAVAMAPEVAAEALLCLKALPPLLLLLCTDDSAVLLPMVLPSAAFDRLLELLRAVAAAPQATEEMLLAAGHAAAKLCTVAGHYGNAPDTDVTTRLNNLSSLAAAPLMRICPQLQMMSMLPDKVMPMSPTSIPLVSASLNALVALISALSNSTVGNIANASLLLAWLPAPLLIALRVAHIAAAASVDALADPAIEAVNAIIAHVSEPHPASGAPYAMLARSAAETALSFATATHMCARLPLLRCVLACAAALPPTAADCAPTLARIHEMLIEHLGGGVLEQRVALAALQTELRRAAAISAASGGTPPAVTLGHLRAVLPALSALLHKATPLPNVDKPAVVRLLLLSCALMPREGMESLLSLVLPLLVGCLRVSTDGPSSPEEKELSTLAHSSITALAKRAPDSFRAVATTFSAETRSRMESATREASTVAVGAVAPGGGDNCGRSGLTIGTAPKIALKMDFSAFGTK